MSTLKFEKQGNERYYISQGEDHFFEIFLDVKADRYVLALDEINIILGGDKDFPDFFYELKEAKKTAQTFEGLTIHSVIGEQSIEWLRNLQRGYDIQLEVKLKEKDPETKKLVEVTKVASFSIYLDIPSDRYMINRDGSPIKSTDGEPAKIFYMREAKKLVLQLAAAEIRDGKVPVSLAEKPVIEPVTANSAKLDTETAELTTELDTNPVELAIDTTEKVAAQPLLH